MVKKKGDYELVDNPKFDIEAVGVSPGTESFPVASPNDAAAFRNRFDEIANGGQQKHKLRIFRHALIRNKKVVLVLISVILIWIIGLGVYSTGGSSSILDYYKSKIGSTSDSSPEVENPTVEINPEYNDDDDFEKDPDAADNDQKENPTVEPKPDDQDNQDTPTVESKPDTQEDKSNDKPEEVAEKPSDDETAPSLGKRITLKDVRSGKFSVREFPIDFITPPAKSDVNDEGLFFYKSADSYRAKKLSDDGFSSKLTKAPFIIYNDKKFQIQDFKPNFDLTYAIVSTDKKSLFRHSSIAQYFLYDIKEGTAEPIAEKFDDKLFFAYWSPNYNFISFVNQDYNIFIKSMDDKSIKQVTTDGNESLLNGKTDWVYEEEVMATDSAIWWSPDESSLLFMKTDESKVPSYNLEYYVQTEKGGATKYPSNKKISYPKPGFSNPIVSLVAYDLSKGSTASIDRSDSKLGDEFIIYEVFYVTENELIIKETDRESNILNFRYYNIETQSSKITFEVDAPKQYNGWIEKFTNPIIIPSNDERTSIGFVDILVINGFNHLVFFDKVDSSSPTTLTSGKWEVSTADLAFNKEKSLLYFSSNEYSPIDRYIYSIDLNSREIKALFEPTEHGYYNSKFSPNAKYASIFYKGPNTPIQKLYEMENFKEIKTVSTSAVLDLAKTEFAIPQKNYHAIKVDENDDGTDVIVNVIEILPKDYDKSKKYPLLVHFYAGPGSETLSSQFDIGFQDSMSSSLNTIALYIEPRGTGGQGWKHRAWANNKIGHWEPRDIVDIAEQWIEKGHVDQEKVALWGWSYGGFTTLKTLEYDAGKTFKYGMAVAPVTDWLFYDSIYTERYMNKPENNKEGYEISRIGKVENLGKTKRFLVMHGTADDNVHIQNTYSLLDMLDMASVTNYDVHVFPDSEHSIYFHNANSIVYGKLASWLKDAFDGDFNDLQQK